MFENIVFRNGIRFKKAQNYLNLLGTGLEWVFRQGICWGNFT